MNGSPVVLDANVVVRYLVADDPDLHRKSLAILEPVRRGERHAILREYIFAEIAFVLRRVYQVNRAEIVTLLGKVLDMMGLQGDDMSTMRTALGYFATNNVSIVDALLVAHAMRHRLALATFDRDLQRMAAAARLKVIS